MSIPVLAAILTVIMLVLYDKWPAFKYYARFIIFGIGSAIAASIFIPIMLLRPFDPRNALLPSRGTLLIARMLGIKFQVRGHKNIVQDVGSVILMNHQSFIDLWVLANVWFLFERCTMISKKMIFYLWPFGLAAWLWGTVYIDRSSRKDALAGINAAAATITTKKAKVCFFPEGTRHGEEKLLPFKKGAFYIAVESQAPLQPIVIKRFDFLDWRKRRFDEGTVVISILPAIPTTGLTKEDVNDLIDKTYKIMSEEYTKLNSETIDEYKTS